MNYIETCTKIAFFLWRSSNYRPLTSVLHVRPGWIIYQNMRETWEKKVMKFEREIPIGLDARRKKWQGGAIKAPPPPNGIRVKGPVHCVSILSTPGKNLSIYQHDLVAMVDNDPHLFHMSSSPAAIASVSSSSAAIASVSSSSSLLLLVQLICKLYYQFKTFHVIFPTPGKNPSIYQHNLVAMVEKNPHRFHMPSRFGEKLQRIPDKLVPRKFALSHKVPDTKGCTKCCVGESKWFVLSTLQLWASMLF